MASVVMIQRAYNQKGISNKEIHWLVISHSLKSTEPDAEQSQSLPHLSPTVSSLITARLSNEEDSSAKYKQQPGP